MGAAGFDGDELEHNPEEDGSAGGGVSEKDLKGRKKERRSRALAAVFVINNPAGLFQRPLYSVRLGYKFLFYDTNCQNS